MMGEACPAKKEKQTLATPKLYVMTNSKKWYAIYTRGKWEKKVSHTLANKNITVYCPLNRVFKKWSDRKKIIYEPLFTSYVFVNLSPGEFSEVKQCDGVINFVYWLGAPAVIRDEEIETIKTFLNENENVKLVKADVNMNDNVRIISGPLTDVHGKVIEIRHKTVKVYLPTLGYQMIAEVEKGNLEVTPYQTHHLAS
jgi:transcription antitermination factor NusG